jgi:hypothetical protein
MFSFTGVLLEGPLNIFFSPNNSILPIPLLPLRKAKPLTRRRVPLQVKLQDFYPGRLDILKIKYMVVIRAWACVSKCCT